MTQRPTRASLVRRALSVAICYVVALQAFLAAYGTVLAVAQGQSDGFVICHSGEGVATGSGDSGSPAKPPCALCAVAVAGGGLLPDPAAIIIPAPVIVGILQPAVTVAPFLTLNPRAGLARAPPSFA